MPQEYHLSGTSLVIRFQVHVHLQVEDGCGNSRYELHDLQRGNFANISTINLVIFRNAASMGLDTSRSNHLPRPVKPV